jgi:hypothetical protein
MIHKFTVLFFLFLSMNVFAQKRFNINGHIRDASTGEDLIGATIAVVQLGRGTITNEYGFYSFTLPVGLYTFRVSFLGYETQDFTIPIDKDVRKDIKLKPKSEELNEVTVSTQALNYNIVSSEIGTVKLKTQDIKAIPVIFGEQDVLKTIQLLPGVSSAGEGSSGFFVRGGQADQNLVLLDDAPVFNPSHLLGFFSVFNSDAINDVKLYKGGVPARYGGRASSVLDIRLREGNSERYSASGGLGLISSRLTLEGPLDKKGSSFLVAGRRTYADLFLLFSKEEDLRKAKLYFYDLNFKAHKEIGEKDRIYFSAYLGRDILKTNDFGFNWGNKTGTLRWAHVFNSKLFSNTSFILNDYNYTTGAAFDFSFDLSAGISGQTFKQNFTWYGNENNTINFGAEANRFTFKPGSLKTVSLKQEEQTFDVPEKNGLESAIYFSNDQKIGNRWALAYGFRISNFYRIGPSNEFVYDEYGETSDTTKYSNNQWFSPYWNVEPRINATHIINDATSIKLGYNRLSQYIHLLQNSTAGTPVDFWIPTSKNVKPQIADQLSIGYFQNFMGYRYQASVETYYKYMQNQIDYKTGASLVLNENVESELLYGKGQAYGAEFFLEKKEGKLTGWIAYTLSRSLRQIEGINRSEWYPSRQDRLHDISVVGIYKFNPRWILSGSWVYNTGTAVTFPAGRYTVEGNIVSLFTDRNSYRMPDYHRLDVGITWLIRQAENRRSELNFSVYNTYARKNPYAYLFSEDPEKPGATQSTMVYLFSAVPSLTWNFKF